MIASADGARRREKTRSLITISEGDTRTQIRTETAKMRIPRQSILLTFSSHNL